MRRSYFLLFAFCLLTSELSHAITFTPIARVIMLGYGYAMAGMTRFAFYAAGVIIIILAGFMLN